MKCNHCKKVIPNQEEIREGDRYFHEECAEIVKRRQKEEVKTFFGWFVAVIAIVTILGIIFGWWINRNEK